MITTNKILTAVKGMLRERFSEIPEEAFYTNLAPSGFLRPSFLVESGPRTKSPLNYGTLAVEVKVIVTVFSQVDKIRQSPVEDLEERSDAVEMLFLGGGVAIGAADDPDRRVLEVAETAVDVGFDYGQITVTLAYEDERPVDEGTYPLMGEAEIDTRPEPV